MLGYFKPNMKLLNNKNKRLYQRLYCSLCKVIQERYGYSKKLFLQHDLLFLYLCINVDTFLEDVDEEQVGCTLFPVRKVNVIKEREEMESLADFSLFTFYTAYLNKKFDNKWSNVKQNIFNKFYGVALEEAIQNLNIDEEQIELLKTIICDESSIEGLTDEIIDPMCHYYATRVKQLFKESKYIYEIAYQMCRIMYYLDAIEDLEKDKKSGNFNILNQIYLDEMQIKAYVRHKVYMSLNYIKLSIPDGRNIELINNIYETSIMIQAKKILE